MNTATLYRLWNLGQDHLVAGRYVAARRALESAESFAWRTHDLQSLARIYLPLLEARRQIRYNAADGLILITSPTDRKSIANFLTAPAGTLLLTTSSANLPRALTIIHNIERHSRRTGQWLESLLLLQHKNQTRLAATADPFFNAGLPITTREAPLLASTDPHLQIPLPPPGTYSSSPAQVTTRESLLIAWEALALRWQHRHPLKIFTPAHELAWLRKALQVDPACEPVTMRLIALAESIERRNVAP